MAANRRRPLKTVRAALSAFALRSVEGPASLAPTVSMPRRSLGARRSGRGYSCPGRDDAQGSRPRSSITRLKREFVQYIQLWAENPDLYGCWPTDQPIRRRPSFGSTARLRGGPKPLVNTDNAPALFDGSP